MSNENFGSKWFLALVLSAQPIFLSAGALAGEAPQNEHRIAGSVFKVDSHWNNIFICTDSRQNSFVLRVRPDGSGRKDGFDLYVKRASEAAYSKQAVLSGEFSLDTDFWNWDGMTRQAHEANVAFERDGMRFRLVASGHAGKSSMYRTPSHPEGRSFNEYFDVTCANHKHVPDALSRVSDRPSKSLQAPDSPQAEASRDSYSRAAR